MKASFDQDHEKLNLKKIKIYLSLICVCLVVILLGKFIYDSRRVQGHHLDYNLIWLAANHFQFGAMRRALVGSIIYLSGSDLVTAAYLLYGISVFLVLILASVLIKRVMEAGGSPLPFALILGALLLFWSEDVGRTDILVAAILLAAAVALIGGWIVLASFCLAVGFQVHEVAAIYGLPLAAALLLQRNRYREYLSTSGSMALVILSCGAVLYGAISFMPHAPNSLITEAITSRLPANYSIGSANSNFALFAMLGGVRAAVDSVCLFSHSVHHYLKPIIALLMAALALASMSEFKRTTWGLSALATAPPIAFLWLTANDMGRWTALAILNVWILCASNYLEPVGGVVRCTWVRAAGAAALIPFLFPLTIPVHFFFAYPSPLIEGGIEKLIGHPAVRTFEECDPTWRASFS